MNIELLKTIGIFSGVIAAFIVAGFSIFTSWLKVRSDRKRVLKESVFNLLGLWKIITYLEIDNVGESIVQGLEKKLHDTPPEDIRKMAVEYYNKLFEAMVRDMVAVWGYGLKDRYLETVQKLSGELPVLAYELYGNAFVLSIVEILDQQEQRARQTAPFPIHEDIDNVLKLVDKHSRRKTYEKALESLEGDILDIARDCNRETYRRCKEKIEDYKTRKAEGPASFISESLDDMPQELSQFIPVQE